MLNFVMPRLKAAAVVLVLGVSLALAWTAPVWANNHQGSTIPSDDPQKSLEKMFNEVREALRASRNGIDEEMFNAKIYKVAEQWFDIESLAVFALGPYAKKAKTDGHFDQFKDTFIRVQVGRVMNQVRGGSPDFLVTYVSTEQGKKNVLDVRTVIIPVGSDGSEVSWRLVNKDGAYKLIDLVVQGTSIMLQLRQEYITWLRAHDGDILGLAAKISEHLTKEDQEKPATPSK